MPDVTAFPLNERTIISCMAIIAVMVMNLFGGLSSDLAIVIIAGVLASFGAFEYKSLQIRKAENEKWK